MSEQNRDNVSTPEQQGPGASMGRTDENSKPQIDDRGTSQSEAGRILRKIRDELFDSSDEKLALALGRSNEEIAEWLRGDATIDGDALMKVRALARERS